MNTLVLARRPPVGLVQQARDRPQGVGSALTSGLTLSLVASDRHVAQRYAGCGSGGEVLPRLASPSLGWRLRIQAQVSLDLLDHRPLEDGRDDLELAAAAVGAALHVDVEDALEQPCPADAVWPRLDSLDFALGRDCSFGGRLRLSGRPLAQPEPAAWRSGPTPHGTE
jgi:hypothetical protein